MENNNSICFISSIKSIENIDGADKIQQVKIEGWSSIVQKDIYKEGELVLCITTDAVIPEELALQWGVKNYLKSGNRVKTIKLKNTYSECIIIHLNNVRPNLYDGLVNIGFDMSNILNIFKYEPPINTHVGLGTGPKKKYHQNPNFSIYAKFPNQKNVPNLFEEGETVITTLKLHGTNARYGIVKKSKITFLDRVKKFFGNKWAYHEYIYGSHNVEKGSDSQGFYSTDIWKEVAERLNIKNNLWKYIKSYKTFIPNSIILYGEIIGPGVQGNNYTYNLEEKNFYGFDVKVDDEYLNYYDAIDVFIDLNLKVVFSYDKMLYNKDNIFNNYVRDKFIPCTNIPHEGIVIRTSDRSKIAKMINPDYLIYADKNNVPDSH